MTQFLQIHPDNPQPRLVKQIVQVLGDGGLVVLPSDIGYALVGLLGIKDSVLRCQRLFRSGDQHAPPTLLCRDLSELAHHASVDNRQFRWLKTTMPGPFTLLLEASKETSRRLNHAAHKTIGVRIAQHQLVQLVLDELQQPLLCQLLPGEDDEDEALDVQIVRERLKHSVDLVVDGGLGRLRWGSVVDLTGGTPVLIAQGEADASVFGL